MDTASLFSPDYATARGRIRAAAGRLGLQVASHAIAEKGPHGEELAIDVVIHPGSRPDRTLVLSSGIHGVEGFLGSAAQLGLLERWMAGQEPLPAVRCVLLHALNPFGFAWRRRVNEANVDLNRNLLPAGEAFCGSPAEYGKLDGLLNPRRGPSSLEPVAVKFLLAIARYGMPALKQAIASGQYEYPRGLFYGGAGPSRLNEMLSAHFDEWIGASRRVMHFDFHTGLGAPASCKLLVDHPLDEIQRRRLGAWFGPDAFEAGNPQGLSYTARGTFGQWCAARYRHIDYLHATAEFGTRRPVSVLAALRAENQAHHYCEPQDPAAEQAKQRLVEAFCPGDTGWRRRVLERSRQLIDQAMRALAG